MTADSPDLPIVSFVRQQGQHDCALACFAMLAELDYEDVLPILPNNRYFEGQVLMEPISTHEVPYLLGRLGLAVRMVYPDAPDQPCGLRLQCGTAHYVVVLPNDTVHDPARGPNRPLTEYAAPFQVWEIYRAIEYETEDHRKGCQCQRCEESMRDARAEAFS